MPKLKFDKTDRVILYVFPEIKEAEALFPAPRSWANSRPRRRFWLTWSSWAKKNFVSLPGVLLALAAILNLLIIGPSHATPIKDQAFEPATPDTIPTIFDGLHWAETFTVGISGTLTKVDVLVSQLFSQQPADLLITIFDTSGGVPTTALTPSAHLSPSTVPIVQHASDFGQYAYLSASFSLPVTANHILAIVASTGDTSQYFWAGVLSGGYPGGQLYRNEGFVWNPEGSEDQAFRTFVNPTTGVPEPASLILVGLGFGGFLIFRVVRCAFETRRGNSSRRYDT